MATCVTAGAACSVVIVGHKRKHALITAACDAAADRQVLVQCGQESKTKDGVTMISVTKPKAGYCRKKDLRIALYRDQERHIEIIKPPPYDGPLVDRYKVAGNKGATLRT